MQVSLETIQDCFEGVIPSLIATVDDQGIPNVSYLSHVYYVDSDHVALSNQFFAKTATNVRINPQATALVVDGRTGEQYMLDVLFEADQTEGAVFERMAAQLQVMSSQHGMESVMALRSADIYRVVGCRAVPAPGGVVSPLLQPPPDRLSQAARLSVGIGGEADVDAMLDRALEGLETEFGFRHTMVLMADEADRLTTLASRGYDKIGVGSEVAFGAGSIGIAAASRRPLRISEMSRGRRFAAAVQAEHRTIPLPGLDQPMSQLAVPMVAQGQLRGVLFAESNSRFAFTREDEAALALIAGQLATALRLVEIEGSKGSASSPREKPREHRAGSEQGITVRYFAFDDSIFINDAYLIKGVPGRLLFHFLQVFVETGRMEFTNREIRLDASLRLPGLKDNLETRLILLRRRLEERQSPIRLSRPARGQIHLDIEGVPALEVVPAG
jgi:GAF domain-containing protein